MTTDNFDEAFKEIQDQNNNQADPPRDVNFLEELVGDDKKFKTVDELARGKYESDQFIERLKREQEELREELSKRSTIEEFMTKMNERKANTSNQAEPPVDERKREEENSNSKSFTQEDLEALLENKLKERETQTKVEKNRKEVLDYMTSVWGSNAAVELNRKASELDMSVQELRAYAESSPKAFYRLVGIEGNTQSRSSNPSAPSSTVSTSRMPDNRVGEKGYAYYEKLRKENPREYFSARVQNEMYRRATELGDRFYSQ